MTVEQTASVEAAVALLTAQSIVIGALTISFGQYERITERVSERHHGKVKVISGIGVGMTGLAFALALYYLRMAVAPEQRFSRAFDPATVFDVALVLFLVLVVVGLAVCLLLWVSDSNTD